MITQSAAAFVVALPDAGRLMALDVGTKTIGVAFCDAGWSFATPDKTIARAKFAIDKAAIAALVQSQGVRGLVVGLPLNMDASDSPRTQSTRAFARNIAELGLPVLLWDERWSTKRSSDRWSRWTSAAPNAPSGSIRLRPPISCKAQSTR